MAFALQLQDSLRHRESQIAVEFAAGESLETVLGRYLLAVESSADTELLTSILLLDGKQLWHGAAPSLPKSYCEAIDGIEIGPDVGSCGTAAYLGRAVYVTDVATDPLWKDFRDLASKHGLRACWSTPIRNGEGEVIGTFAIYHLTPRSPTPDEVEAIRLITGHVAQAIEWSRSRQDERQLDLDSSERNAAEGQLKLVSINDPLISDAWDGSDDAQAFQIRLQAYAAEFDSYADMVESRELANALKAVAGDCRNLLGLIRDGPDRDGRNR
jgi:GAF domain-containing protein